MKTVFKYPIPISSRFILDLPRGATILTAQDQGGNAQLWAEVEPEAPKVTRYLSIVGTGHEVLGNSKYICTFQQEPFVWHLYERVADDT